MPYPMTFTLLVFGAILVGVSCYALLRPSGFTGIDAAKIPQIRNLSQTASSQ